MGGSGRRPPRSAAARPTHGAVQGLVFADLAGPFYRGRGGPGRWWLVVEPDVELGPNDIVVPDLAGWRRTRLPDLPAERPVRLAPDWVCEVASPRNKWSDRGRKADLYLRASVPHYWIVDPEERTLEAFEARDGAWLRLGAWTDGDEPRIPPFEAIAFDVGGVLPPAR
ncbi:MAG: Uma2 family endonuclease [Vicinamibacteria bacterium]